MKKITRLLSLLLLALLLTPIPAALAEGDNPWAFLEAYGYSVNLLSMGKYATYVGEDVCHLIEETTGDVITIQQGDTRYFIIDEAKTEADVIRFRGVFLSVLFSQKWDVSWYIPAREAGGGIVLSYQTSEDVPSARNCQDWQEYVMALTEQLLTQPVVLSSSAVEKSNADSAYDRMKKALDGSSESSTAEAEAEAASAVEYARSLGYKLDEGSDGTLSNIVLWEGDSKKNMFAKDYTIMFEEAGKRYTVSGDVLVPSQREKARTFFLGLLSRAEFTRCVFVPADGDMNIEYDPTRTEDRNNVYYCDTMDDFTSILEEYFETNP